MSKILAGLQRYHSNLLQNIQLPDMNTVRAALIDAQQDPNVSTQAQQLIDLFSKEHL